MDTKSRNKKTGLPPTLNRLPMDASIIAVQNKLRSVSNGQAPPAVLKDCATIAIDIFKITQDDEDIAKDTEFVNLALDGCGLVYLIIHKGIAQVDRQTIVALDMEEDAPKLAWLVISQFQIPHVVVLADQYCRQLQNIRVFFQKKANGKLYRRVNPLKRYEDSQKIAVFRSELQQWITRLGVCFVQVR
ncbi:hypothetical protein HYPSUDRAFT_898186 [Hypholoma sublateritium FD-334 SS-4]|uniref:Uncharacterized protein n=1 Tax=Hypholoma sublateritium (strain FD-334 SS-4) TaxID=945553 RepID=A0A0D2KXD0_HYPSF|nr:hypothetical protein HYPSUDRAFT_898186 [Hypholoma sublateritium FD-334 SS-4]